jgi:type IV pilus assembly protein PilB
MPTVLNPAIHDQDKSQVNISTVAGSKTLRVKRLKDDLDHGFIEVDTQAEAKYLGYPYIDLYGYPIDTGHLSLISKEEVQKYQIGVFSVQGRDAYFATNEPGLAGQNELISRVEAQDFTAKIYLVSTLSMQKLIRTYDAVVTAAVVDDTLNVSQGLTDKYAGKRFTLQEVEKIVSTLSLSEILETILAIALSQDASDIHFEPEKDFYNLRLRLDGVLHTVAKMPVSYRKGIESRIKIQAGLKLNVDNVPQDGRFTFKAQGREIDVRVSMLPSNYGYSIVMRLLGTGSVNLFLKDLGFTGVAKARIEAAISRPQGLILTTGPTGSGKTTTLYTFLNSLNDGESKIITLEDPIEYKLSGISQTQIDANAGYTFAGGLRSILRQDPDLVMVGEIRDGETAEIAVQAALTGHQVLSTIHTNDAAGSIPRLMEMGIKGFLLADSLNAIIGQRLVRKICQNCKHVDVLDAEAKKIVIEALSELPETANVTLPEQLTFHTSSGCVECSGLGYKGRVGCYEVMTMTQDLKNLVSEQFPSISQVRNTATKDGMLTMFQDGILKALDGLTDVKEILRNIDPGA